MPQNQIPTAPSLSWMQRLFGSGVDSMNWPALQQAWAGRQIEMPSESSRVNRVMNMGPLFKMMNPSAYAATGPLGTVSLNRPLIEQDKQDINDVLAHELAHVGQGKMGFLRQFYQPSQVENEAIDREAMRKVRREDIVLPRS